MRHDTRALLALALVALPGCGGAPSAGSCVNLPFVCTDYVGSGYTWSQVQSSCKGPSSQSACTSTSRVGRCRMWAGLPTEVIFNSYPTQYDEASAQNDCRMGEWLGP